MKIRYFLDCNAFLLAIAFLPIPGDGKLLYAQSKNAQIRDFRSVYTEPYETTVIAASEPGIVEAILIHEGESVKKGQVIARLDSSVLNETLKVAIAKAQSTAKVDAAAAALRLHDLRKKSFDELSSRGHANQSEMDKVQFELESAKSDLLLAKDESNFLQLEVERIRALLQQRVIVSPMDGIITELHKNQGEFINGSEPNVATIVRLDKLKARFYLSGLDLDHMKQGMSANIYLGPNREPAKATVQYVSPTIDPKSGTGRVDLVLANPDLQIRSGIPCELETSATDVQMIQPSREASLPRLGK